ncbi:MULTISPECIES: TadA family conjugal transfer-associated ATPase [unclassified Microbacterium]|uniref:TadA family conjugal transfer-associated ATPase n=1 Tax=unclassified Microbacterium TaxID=2609290 RepID=UPI00214C0195|nr:MULTISPECIES: TadA family conjugal transfer-associated ATPase [unclassified Microbacterium]MCR2783985.1 TadA family conjugal transfer-associated ATPase [Microbacterium sp. zg.B96]WIM15171.1 TadA family conjugal transfer-associated ATPase [Microbacterium sp. zg-B96]
MTSTFVVVPRRAAAVTPTAEVSALVGVEPRPTALADPLLRPPAAVAAPHQVLARKLPTDAALAPLAPYLADPAVTDVFVNGAEGLFVDRGHGAQPVLAWRADEADVRALAVDLIALGGRHLDDATPCVDVQLAGGIRVHAVLPPVSRGGTMISVRAPAAEVPDLDALQTRGMFGTRTRELLEAVVDERVNVLITGATGVGKTTLLAALLGRVPSTERIVTIEDVAELRLRHPHHVRLEARQPNLEGAGCVSLARLVREALRMRPDRLVVGECRGEEVRELLTALNTGHHGGAGTLHAGGIDDVPARLEALGALAGMDERAVARQVVSAIGCIVHVARGADGARKVAGMAWPVLSGGALSLEAVPR